METCHDHEIAYWPDIGCAMCKAASEIARLQAEVERTNDVLESQAHVIIDLRAKRDAAHNDAIDAAASLCDLLSRATIDDGPLRRSAERCRDGVLALKR